MAVSCPLQKPKHLCSWLKWENECDQMRTSLHGTHLLALCISLSWQRSLMMISVWGLVQGSTLRSQFFNHLKPIITLLINTFFLTWLLMSSGRSNSSPFYAGQCSPFPRQCVRELHTIPRHFLYTYFFGNSTQTPGFGPCTSESVYMSDDPDLVHNPNTASCLFKRYLKVNMSKPELLIYSSSKQTAALCFLLLRSKSLKICQFSLCPTWHLILQ